MQDFRPEQPFAVVLEIDDEDLRESLRRALATRPDLRPAFDGEEVVAVIITDRAELAGEDGGAPVLLLTGGADLPTTTMRPNAVAFASENRQLILSAAHLVAAGYDIRSSASAGRWSYIGDAADGWTMREPAPLSARERQVLGLLVEGASNKEIARRLGISVHTAKFHVAGVLENLGAKNRSDAVAIALRDGYVAL